jgi:hypothetical protein
MFERNDNQTAEKDHFMGIGMAIGIAMCMPLGVVLFIVTGNPGLMGAGAGTGIAIGIAIGERLYQRNRRQGR